MRRTSPALRFALSALVLGATLSSFGQSHPVEPGHRATAAPDFYEPYAFLIGEWDVAPEAGGPAFGRATLRWGPNRSYIWYASSFLQGGKVVPHFEGLLVWNGVEKDLDMLISMDLNGGRVQEKRSVFVDGDGTVVREITAAYSAGVRPLGMPPAGPGGASARFRQTFRKAGPDRILTAALRQEGAGWVATFPGSDRLVMIRRPGFAS